MAEPMSSSEWVPADTFGARLALIRIERHWNIATAAAPCAIPVRQEATAKGPRR